MSILDLSPGLHESVPADVYHERHMGVVGRGALAALARSPMHYRAWVNGEVPDEDTPAKAFGRAMHTAILEPSVFDRAYAVEPDFGDCRANKATGTTKEQGAENKARRDAWRAEHAGFTFVSAEDDRALRGMSASVRAHPLASKMLAGGVAETTAVWVDDETGLRCRVRADYWIRARELVVDIKSTTDASERAFTRDVFKYGYHVQHALYRAGFAAVGLPAKHFVFVVVEKEPPYAVATYTLDEKAVAVAHEQVRSGMRLLRDCMHHDIWPGYAVSIRTLETPPWAA